MADSGGIQIRGMLNTYLQAMEHRVESREITRRHFGDIVSSCKIAADVLGRELIVAGIRAADFSRLRRGFPATWRPLKTGNEIQQIRSAFRWAAESEVIPALPNFGPDFR